MHEKFSTMTKYHELYKNFDAFNLIDSDYFSLFRLRIES
jgi:hypothetical protein